MVEKVANENIETYLSNLNGDWHIDDDQYLARRFKLQNYSSVVGFVNKIAQLADEQNHHPDITFGWNYCLVRLKTHEIKGLSNLDFDLAAQIDGLFGNN